MMDQILRKTHVLHLSPMFDHAIVFICAFIGIQKVYTNAKKKGFSNDIAIIKIKIRNRLQF